MSKHTPTPWPQNENPIADLLRAFACVNAFHSDDGREVATEQITPGLFWEMVGLLKILNASPPDFATGKIVAALLAKLEQKESRNAVV